LSPSPFLLLISGEPTTPEGGAGHSIKEGAQAIGRSRGGLTTKIHALVHALGNPVEVMLSPGRHHDLTCTESLIEAVDSGALLADKAFDADPFIAAVNARAITPVIRPSPTERLRAASGTVERSRASLPIRPARAGPGQAA
jgi:transposase